MYGGTSALPSSLSRMSDPPVTLSLSPTSDFPPGLFSSSWDLVTSGFWLLLCIKPNPQEQTHHGCSSNGYVQPRTCVVLPKQLIWSQLCVWNCLLVNCKCWVFTCVRPLWLCRMIKGVRTGSRFPLSWDSEALQDDYTLKAQDVRVTSPVMFRPIDGVHIPTMSSQASEARP